MNRNELIKLLVPAIKRHWKHSTGRDYSEMSIYNAIKGNSMPMLWSRYERLKSKGYIRKVS